MFSNTVKDNLTGLYTREILNPLFNRLCKEGNFSLFMVDIDNFKLINDCHGHSRGDQILVDMAGFLSTYVKDGYIVRMGGDEFVIILPGCRKKDSAQFANKLLLDISDRIFKGKPDITLRLSTGIALYPEDSRELKPLLKKADERLYVAKRNGRNQYCIENEKEKAKPHFLTKSTRLIGREKVFLSMKARLDKLLEGNSGVLIVKGEEGVGKTFLCKRFIDYAHIRGVGIRGVEVSHHPFYASYDGLRRIVKGLFLKEEEIKPFFERKGVEYGNELTKILYPETVSESAFTGYRDYNIYRSFISLIKMFARNGSPLLLFIDGFENIDEKSLSLLHHICLNPLEAPVLILIATRRGSRYSSMAKVIKKEDTSVFTIKGFSKKNYKTFVKTLLQGGNVSQNLLDFLFEKTEGNPLFTKELLGSFIEDSMLSKKKGVWTLKENGNINIVSGSLEAILEDKIQHLTMDEKSLLALCSVMGKKFEVRFVKGIQKMDIETMVRLLRKPVELGIIEDSGDGRYSFRSLYYEMFYGRIPLTERRILHKKIARILEKEKGERREIFLHYSSAFEKSKARFFAESICKEEMNKGNYKGAQDYIDYLLASYEKENPHYRNILSLAGKCYAMNGLYEKAIRLYRQIIEIAPVQKFRVTMEISDLYGKQGKYSLALGELLKIKSRVSPLSCELFNRIADTLLQIGEMERAEEYVKKGIDISRRFGVKEQEARGYYIIAGIFWYRGEYELSEDFLKKALKICNELGEDYEKALIMNRLGIVKWSTGKLDESVIFIKKAVDFFRKNYRIEEENRAYTNLGVISETQGEWQQAKEYYKKSIEIGLFLKLMPVVCNNYNNLATLLLKEGKYDDAIGYLKKVIKLRLKMGRGIKLASSYHNLGAAFMFCGNYKAAYSFLSKARRIFDAKGTTGMRLDNLNTFFELFVYRREFEKAEKVIENLDDLLEHSGTDFQKAQFYRVMARYLRTRKKLNESRKFARKSIELLSDEAGKYELGKSFLELGLTLLEEGNRKEAEKSLMKSKSIFMKLGAAKALERVNMVMKKTMRK